MQKKIIKKYNSVGNTKCQRLEKKYTKRSVCILMWVYMKYRYTGYTMQECLQIFFWYTVKYQTRFPNH